jgi:hypothetical protein
VRHTQAKAALAVQVAAVMALLEVVMLQKQLLLLVQLTEAVAVAVLR